VPKRVPGGRVDKEEALRKERLLKALKRHRCLVSFACNSIKCSTTTYYEYLERDEEFAKKVAELKEGVIDWAESKLQKAMESGEYVPTMFYLKCQAKKRGYIEKQEIKLSGDKDNPAVPDSMVSVALAAILEQERKRLESIPLEEDG
jgi:hypothetical protein